MAPESKPGVRFDKLLNFRDVGDCVGNSDFHPTLRSGRLYRSARLDETTASDRDKLTKDFQINTVIDLRSKTELINAAKKHSEVAVPPTDGSSTSSLKVPGLKYAEINLNGKGFERALIWQLRYSSLAKLIFLMATGYRTEGIAVLGKEIMQPRGLVGLGLDTIEHSGPEIKQVFDVLSDESAYPVLVHCTQGKDRTGITVLLVLLMCHVDMRAITADYCRSEGELESEKEERMKEIASIGLDESFAQCPPDFCERIQAHLVSKYGGVESYLAGIGVSKAQQQTIRDILMEP